MTNDTQLFTLLDSLAEYSDWRRTHLRELGAPSWVWELPSEREDYADFFNFEDEEGEAER